MIMMLTENSDPIIAWQLSMSLLFHEVSAFLSKITETVIIIGNEAVDFDAEV